MRSENTYQSARALLALLLALVLVVAACGADGDDSGDSGDDAADSADDFESFSADDGDDAADDEGGVVAESEVDADADVANAPLGAGGTAGALNAADLGRKLIFTASLNVGVDDVAASSAEATSIIEGLGGFLFGQSTEGGVNARSELTFKVLPEDFNVALERLGYTIDERDDYSFYLGCVQMVVRDADGLTGIADPRRDGSARGPRR